MKVYERLTCSLDVPRTNIFSISLSQCDTEQLVERTVQLCFFPSKDVAGV
jgi:hypothetical protein